MNNSLFNNHATTDQRVEPYRQGDQHPRGKKIKSAAGALLLVCAMILTAWDDGATPATTATAAPALTTPTTVAPTLTLTTAPSPTLTTLPSATQTPAPPSSTPTTASTPTALATSAADTTGTPAASAVQDAIKSVISKGNQEEEQALAANDPTLMQDTSTTAYYRTLEQDLNGLASSGISAIKLVNTAWGSITLQSATSAQATTDETWDTTFSDGGVLHSTDQNVYTLVLQGGSWKIQSDDHPDARQSQTTTGAPVATATPPAASGATATPVVTTDPNNQSRNWSGYQATGGKYTAVSGSWVVPTVSASGAAAADATWVGIGGVDSTDLIQAGTYAEVAGGQVAYTAWIETLPQYAQPIPIDVAAGDSISVSLKLLTGANWQISIDDVTARQSYQITVRYASSLSSAEWIEEAPTSGRQTLAPLDSFGAVTFTNGSAVVDGAEQTITQAGGQVIVLYNGANQVLAQPSALDSNGSGFTVTRTSAPSTTTFPRGRR